MRLVCGVCWIGAPVAGAPASGQSVTAPFGATVLPGEAAEDNLDKSVAALGDVNGDGVVDGSDIGLLPGAWGAPGERARRDGSATPPYPVAMTNLETVQALYAAFGAGDTERIVAIMDPAIEWNQCAGFPITGTRVGPRAVFEGVFGPLQAAWDGFHASVDEWLDAGDTVVALGHYEGVNRETGKPMRAAFAHVYDIKDGRIRRYRQVADSWMVREAMG